MTEKPLGVKFAVALLGLALILLAFTEAVVILRSGLSAVTELSSLVLIVLAVLLFVLAYFLWQLNKWARLAVGVLGALNIVSGALEALTGKIPSSSALMWVLILYFLFFEPKAKAAFEQGKVMASSSASPTVKQTFSGSTVLPAGGIAKQDRKKKKA